MIKCNLYCSIFNEKDNRIKSLCGSIMLNLSCPVKEDFVKLSPSIVPEAVRVLTPTRRESNEVVEEDKISHETLVFCGCGKQCKSSHSLCADCEQNKSPKELATYLYVKVDQSQFDRYWFKLLKKELYCKLTHNTVQ